jgi:hypothetical protein
VNTGATLITALIAIPALVISLITYSDQKSDQEENNLKEAARISWYFQVDKRTGAPELLVFENRSLRPVYDTWLNLEDESNRNIQSFYIDGTNSPCTRTTYELKNYGKSVRMDLEKELFFRDTLNTWWRLGYRGGLSSYGEDVNLRLPEVDMVATWGLQPKYADLDGCA